jgi:predicted hotdog family 3-hydroxylacyl-ACP dehydratase
MAASIPLDGLLPQRGAMRLLDTACAGPSDSVVCRGVVRTDNPFLDPGGRLPAWALLEHLAQGAAALRAVAGGTPEPGHLATVGDARLSAATVSVGDTVEVQVRQTGEHGAFLSFEGEATVGGVQLCRCTLLVRRTSY